MSPVQDWVSDQRDEAAALTMDDVDKKGLPIYNNPAVPLLQGATEMQKLLRTSMWL